MSFFAASGSIDLLKFSKPGLVSSRFTLLCEDKVGVSEQLFFPGCQQLFPELMLTTDLGCDLRSGQKLEDDAGLDFRFEFSTCCHLWIPLSGL
jgi:hypothetical protein